MNDSRPKLPLYTYLMSVDGLLKIGRSHHPGNRRRVLLSAASSVEILAVLPSEALSEATALALFGHLRIKRREWFEDTAEIRQFFETFRPRFVPEPWHHACAFFWCEDPRLPRRIRRELAIDGRMSRPAIKKLFRPYRFKAKNGGFA